LDLNFDINSPVNQPYTRSNQISEKAKPNWADNEHMRPLKKPGQSREGDDLLRLRGGASSKKIESKKRKAIRTVQFGQKKTRILMLSDLSEENQGRISGQLSGVVTTPLPSSLRPGHASGSANKEGNFVDISSRNGDAAELRWNIPCPDGPFVLSTLPTLSIPRLIPKGAYYSRDEDVPANSREYAGKGFRLVADSLPYLPTFDVQLALSKTSKSAQFDTSVAKLIKIWRIARKPPLSKQPGAVHGDIKAVLRVRKVARGQVLDGICGWRKTFAHRLNRLPQVSST
jgi:hypothetical protein